MNSTHVTAKRFVKCCKRALDRLWQDENGGEVLEYALIAGLVVIGCIAMITRIGTKVLARWSSLNSSL